MTGTCDPTSQLYPEWSPANDGYGALILVDATDLTYLLIDYPEVWKFQPLAPIVNFYSQTDTTATAPYAIDIERNLYDMSNGEISVYQNDLYADYFTTSQLIAAFFDGSQDPNLS